VKSLKVMTTVAFLFFTARRYAENCLSYSNSICFSVRPSVVRPSHTGIVSKRLNVG